MQTKRSVLTVLINDIVDSTVLASKIGDQKWRALRDKYETLANDEMARHGGRVVDTAGDGFLAVFEVPAEAVACAHRIAKQSRDLGLEVRSGMHTGECELRGNEVHGIAVHLAARVSALAGPSEVLVSSTVKDLAAGSGITFTDRGSKRLKGVSGTQRIFAASDVARRTKKATSKMPTVMIVDDHPLWRNTLKKVIEQGRAGKVVAQASDGEEALKVAAKTKPDVVIMDMHLPSMDGAATTRALHTKQPDVKVLMLSSSDAKKTVLEAVRGGASGYLIKTAESDEITDAVRRIHAGELVFPAELTALVLAELHGEGAATRVQTARVAIAAEAVIDRDGLAKVLGSAGFTVTAEAEDAGELIEMISGDPPDVLVVDIGGRRKRAEATLRALREVHESSPDIGLLVLADEVDPEHAVALVTGEGQGSVGYVLRDRVRRIDELSDAIARVAQGESVIDPEVVAVLVAQRAKKSPIDQLTEREREVLALMAEGRSNQAISESLHLSPKSVEGHVGNIFSKLSLEPAPDDHRRVLAVLIYLSSV